MKDHSHGVDARRRKMLLGLAAGGLAGTMAGWNRSAWSGRNASTCHSLAASAT